MRILSADIGGTHTRLALVRFSAGAYRIEAERRYASADYPEFADIARDFMARTHSAGVRACLGVAGPVDGETARLTNLPWRLSAPALRRALGLQSVSLLNDLEALAWSVTLLADDDLVTLQAGDGTPGGNAAVIAAGTGLGEAGLFDDGTRLRPFATEGGHSDFSPVSEQDFRLSRFLAQRFGHVSWERVLSGQGLVAIHAFLLDQHGLADAPPAPETNGTDPAAWISQRALAGDDPVCVETLGLFVRYYGAEAGNLALKCMATAGVYLGGGIAPKILPALQAPAFLEAFCAKGRMRPLLEAMPVRVICNDAAALLGLAHYARLEGGAERV